VHNKCNEGKADLKMANKVINTHPDKSGVKRKYQDYPGGKFAKSNPGRPKGTGIVSKYIEKLDMFDSLAKWINKQVEEGNEKVIIPTHLALVGKFGAIPTEDKERNPFDLGPTETVTDIKNALERIIQAEAAGKITHEEADAFEKRLSTMFTYIQAAAHESIQTISHLSATEAFDILEKRNTEIKSLEKIN